MLHLYLINYKNKIFRSVPFKIDLDFGFIVTNSEYSSFLQ